MRLLVVLTVAAALAGCATTNCKTCPNGKGAAAATCPKAKCPGACPMAKGAGIPTADIETARVIPTQHLDALKTYAFGQSTGPLLAVERDVQASLRAPELGRIAAAQLAAFLGTDATPDAKQFACRQLAIVGTPAEVPTLAPLLLKAETADMARYALEPIPGPEVDAALVGALAQAPAEAKVGIVNSLGARRAESAKPALQALASDADAKVAAAAKAALASY